MMTRDECQVLDKNDVLATLREAFALPAREIYLDGNSLGARPRLALDRARQIIEVEWGKDLIRSWNTAAWFDLPVKLGDKIAPLIGAGPGEVVVTDTTSTNLFKALAAALRIQAASSTGRARKLIVSERDNFPTDLYIAQGLTRWLDDGYALRLVDGPDQMADALDEDVAVAMLSHVNYRSGRLLDMRGLTARAHEKGVLAIWDLAHSVGALPVDLTACSVDFAVGCTYKYLNGGPGAPAFIWVAPRHLAQFEHPLTGWWGHAAPFAMRPEFDRCPSIRGALCGTQPIVSLALVECGLDVFASIDMAGLRAKSLALTDLFIQLIEQRCASHPLALLTPREHQQRGSHVSLVHKHGYAIMQALIERGVIGDYRDPDIMRFGFTPLYTRYVDVWDAVEVLMQVLDTKGYVTNVARQAVT